MSLLLGTEEGEDSRPSWPDLGGSPVARPNWGPAEKKGQERPLHLENTVAEGFAKSEVGVHCDPPLEERVTGISGNLMEK